MNGNLIPVLQWLRLESNFRTLRSVEFKTEMAESTYSRKLDSMGRIMIPIKLREQLNLIPGREYYFEVRHMDGRNYICIDCGETDALQKAVEFVKLSGLEVNERK